MCDELFLCALYAHELTVQSIYALLKRRSLFLNLSRLCWSIVSRLALDHDVNVDEFVGKRAHVVLEAEGVFPDGVGSEDIVSLALALSIEDDLIIRVLDLKVNVK